MSPSGNFGRVLVPAGHGMLGDNGFSDRYLTVAISARASECPNRLLLARDNGFAVEYTPDPDAPDLIREHVGDFIASGLPVRFHCRFFDYEMGNEDVTKAEEAINVHLHVIDAIAGLGEPFITVHLNLQPKTPFVPERGVENLSRLVEHGKKVGVTVCLENLRRGPTSNPENVLAWAKQSGAMITLDVGHAVSCEHVKNGRLTVDDFVRLFGERLLEAHMYAKEEDRHYPIEDMASMEPIVNRLVTTDCRWWTIELDDFAEALDTRQKLVDYLSQSTAS